MTYTRKKKKEKCPKCGHMRYPHHHHILPKCLFGKIGPLTRLCSDCHEDYHFSLRQVLRGKLKEHPPIFYVKHFVKWMGALGILSYILFEFLI